MMKIKIHPTTEQRDYAIKLMKQKWGREKTHYEGSYHEKLFGLIGQIIICDFFKQPRPIDITKPDGLFDLKINGITFDVKVRSLDILKNEKWFWNSVSEDQGEYNVDAYLFLIYYTQTGKYESVGWIEKEEFKLKCEFHEANYRANQREPAYEIQDKMLSPFSSLVTKK